MKILFLSFEGVLRSEKSFIRKKKEHSHDPDGLCEHALGLLAEVLFLNPGLHLILTGPEKSLEPRDLRFLLTLEASFCTPIVDRLGLKKDDRDKALKTLSTILYERICDTIPSLRNGERGDEIRRYLMHTSRRISQYLVLDSGSDLSALKDSDCIITDPAIGLTEAEVKRIRKRMGAKR